MRRSWTAVDVMVAIFFHFIHFFYFFDLLPHGDVDDDEEQQGERRDPAAHDESHGREQGLVHDLHRGDKTNRAS